MAARAFTVALVTLTGLMAMPLACGSAPTASTGVDGGNDAAVDALREATPDSGVAVPSPVTEKPAPACHDLVQRGDLVASESNPASPPRPNPLETIAPGFYKLVSSTEYATRGPVDWPAIRTTFYVSPSRFYVLIEGEPPQPRVVATFTWSIRGGILERTYVCSSENIRGRTFSQRIDPSENGFTIYTANTAGVDGYGANRYVRVDD